MGKRQPLQQVVLEKRDHYMQETQTGLFHIVYKNKLKWIKDLNVRPEAIKLLEENQTPGLESFLDLSLYSRETKVKISKWHNIKLKSFRTAKKTINKTKKQPAEWEKTFAKDKSDNKSIQKTSKTQHQKSKQSNEKMGRGPE